MPRAMRRRSALFLAGMLLVVVLQGTLLGADREIRLLYVNDFHGYAVPFTPHRYQEPRGGAASLAFLVGELRSEKPSLLLAAGDMIQGNNWANLFRGKSVIELMNAMAFDAMVAGNHEFDFGPEVLAARIGEARFPVLGANVEGVPGLKPHVLREVGGLKVAIIGVTTEDTPVTTNPRNVRGLRFLSHAETVAKEVAQLRPLADLIVVLSHIGYAKDLELAAAVPGIDVIVGGHTHTKPSGIARRGQTLVVQAWEHGLVLGVLDLTVRDRTVVDASGRLEEVRPEPGKVDAAVAAIVGRYEREVDRALGEVLGEAQVDLKGTGSRLGETNMGDFVADIVREIASAEAALLTGGGFRGDIARGPVRLGDVYNALPFDSYVVAVRMTGRDIIAALEHGVSAVEDEDGRFPQVSGIVFSYDPSRPKGARVTTVLVAGVPLAPERTYIVATTDFVAAGGDGYAGFGQPVQPSGYTGVAGDRLTYNDPGKWIKDIVADRIRAKKVIAPVVEGRIREER